jgi:hypothetical protein
MKTIVINKDASGSAQSGNKVSIKRYTGRRWIIKDKELSEK